MPNIIINRPQVYTWSSPFWTPLSPSSHPIPLGCPRASALGALLHVLNSHCSIYFTYGNVHVSVLFFQIIPPLLSPTESINLLFFFFWRYWGFHCCEGFSLVMVSGVYSSHCDGFSRGAQTLGHAGSVVWFTGLAALKHVESSQIRDWTSVPSSHWVNRKTLNGLFLWSDFATSVEMILWILSFILWIGYVTLTDSESQNNLLFLG